jgi:hypothetical protein
LPGQQLAAGRKRAWNARNTVTDNRNDWSCINLLRVRRIESTELSGRRRSRGQYQAGQSTNETEQVIEADHERNSIEEIWSKKVGRPPTGRRHAAWFRDRQALSQGKRGTIKKVTAN